MQLPLRQLPSLELVRGFVAVGRRMSITLAARDLGVTQSAVSRQVRTLEDQLGVALFVRGHRAIAFTAEGERLFRSANAAVQQVQDALGELTAPRPDGPVTVSATIGFTSLWLLPRLGGLQREHPALELRISANNRVVDLRADGIDLAVRYAAPSSVPSGARRLFGEAIAPVAHPSLGVKLGPGALEAARVPLLEFDDPDHPWLQWRSWLGARGWASTRLPGLVRFNQYDQVIQAALASGGIALGRLPLIRPLLEERQLVVVDSPRGTVVPTHAYWLLRAEPRPRDDVRRVAAWLEAEAARTRAEGPRPRGAPRRRAR